MEAMNAEGGDMPLAEFSEQFDRIVYFLNRVSFCVEGKLCDREDRRRLFPRLCRFLLALLPGYVEKQRKAGSPTYAEPIEKYVRRAARRRPPAQ